MFAAHDALQHWGLQRQGARSCFIPTFLGRVHGFELQGHGSLPPVVLLHGLGSCGADFAPMFRRLARHHRRVIAIDLPGHGESDAPSTDRSLRSVATAVAEAMGELVQEPCILVGNSLGGAIASLLAHLVPSAVTGLCLVSPAGAAMSRAEWSRLQANLDIEAPTRAVSFIRRTLPTLGREAFVYALGVRYRFQKPGLRAVLPMLHTGDHLQPHELDGLSMPVTLVWGQQEKLLPLSGLEYFRRHLPPHAVILSPPHFGHVPFIEHTDEIESIIRATAEAAVHRERQSLAPVSTRARFAE